MKIKHISKQGDIGFLNSLVKAIVESTENVDVSLLLNDIEAHYILELFEEQNGLFLEPNEFENDFGELTGTCLVTIVKEDKFVQVYVEDYACLYDGAVTIKYHQTDILLLLEGHVFEDVDKLLERYDVEKTIFVSFEDESNEVTSLLFS